MKTYDIIYSLGCDCACSLFLKNNGLRLQSGPFDWLTKADFEERFTFLLNDFENFLNPDDFRYLDKDSAKTNDTNCDYYENVSTGFYFYHDFPKNVSFESAFATVKNKYTRRIERFYRNITKKNKILLVWFSHYHTTNDDTVLTLCTSLCRKIGKNVDFLIIENESSKKGQQASYNMLASNITRVKMCTTAFDEFGNLTTMGNEKECNEIFSKYRLLVPRSVCLYRFLLKVIAETICLIVPVKRWRRKIRKGITY